LLLEILDAADLDDAEADAVCEILPLKHGRLQSHQWLSCKTRAFGLQTNQLLSDELQNWSRRPLPPSFEFHIAAPMAREGGPTHPRKTRSGK
jgi:hypothetical protein